jgi:hypothetical protein
VEDRREGVPSADGAEGTLVSDCSFQCRELQRAQARVPSFRGRGEAMRRLQGPSPAEVSHQIPAHCLATPPSIGPVILPPGVSLCLCRSRGLSTSGAPICRPGCVESPTARPWGMEVSEVAHDTPASRPRMNLTSEVQFPFSGAARGTARRPHVKNVGVVDPSRYVPAYLPTVVPSLGR